MLKRFLIILLLLLTIPHAALAIGRVDTEGATVDNKFTEGNPALAEPATVVGVDWLNDVQEELVGVVEASGQTPVKGEQDQLLKALVLRVDTLAQLQAVTGKFAGQVIYVGGRSVVGDGYQGDFYWRSGDQSADEWVINDPLQGVFARPTAPGDGSTGVWVRRDWDGSTARPEWFASAISTGAVDAAAAVQAADNLVSARGSLSLPLRIIVLIARSPNRLLPPGKASR